ncbi:hypothetical protein Syun_023745 [Stephania yunnanensis]|uniref:Uncharacterized protein n=1 Tax=Stephania yunnanensis TaxID=152371 RepID=A0AAP0FAC1_9MAGN
MTKSLYNSSLKLKYSTIEKATESFDDANKLGKGCFETVYEKTPRRAGRLIMGIGEVTRASRSIIGLFFAQKLVSATCLDRISSFPAGGLTWHHLIGPELLMTLLGMQHSRCSSVASTASATNHKPPCQHHKATSHTAILLRKTARPSSSHYTSSSPLGQPYPHQHAIQSPAGTVYTPQHGSSSSASHHDTPSPLVHVLPAQHGIIPSLSHQSTPSPPRYVYPHEHGIRPSSLHRSTPSPSAPPAHSPGVGDEHTSISHSPSTTWDFIRQVIH